MRGIGQNISPACARREGEEKASICFERCFLRDATPSMLSLSLSLSLARSSCDTQSPENDIKEDPAAKHGAGAYPRSLVVTLF